ncbi:MAG: aspartate aminotransferase family protein, partial [Firmicutes bacterium]|nr:aspartate aminotransferase family protein [Bacillota bacterium]
VYKSNPICISKAEGVFLYDQAGRRYLDFSAQFSAAAIGHGHPKMLQNLKNALDELVGINPMFVTEPRAVLAQRLISLLPDCFGKCLFGCTGSDANEFALKVAKVVKGGGKIFSFWRGYHGATAGAAGASAKAETIQTNRSIQELIPQGFIHASPPYCYRCDFKTNYPTCDLLCLHYLERQIRLEGPSNVAAIILEPIIAGGGVITPPPGYLKRLRELCDQYEILLILDEVVTGFGRTGSMFAFEQEDIVPDILVLGKALTGGYIPGSATIVKSEFAELMDQLHLHGHTHSGYPLMCIAGLTTLDIMVEERLVERSRQMGELLGEGLCELSNRYSFIGDVRGRGLLYGIDIISDPVQKEPNYNLTQKLTDALLKEGLVVEPEINRVLGSSILVLHPPLTVTESDIFAAVDLLDKVFSTV